MSWKQLFATKSLEMLDAEARGENRLRRILGPIGLTSLGIGAIIGAGIFVMTGRVAANDAGPGILVSFLLAGFACALAAFCYAEFASMAPVAGSAYTYAYATLGELMAWIIGWDLILEYAMSAATVAASWSEYLNKFLEVSFGVRIPEYLCSDPFSTPGAWLNLPAVAVLAACTFVLVIGIRESAASNTAMVLIKIAVVLFVIVVGLPFVDPGNWTSIPPEARRLPEQILLPDLAAEHARLEANFLAAGQAWGDEFDLGKARAVTVATTEGAERTLVGSVPEGAVAKADALETRSDQLTRQALAVFLTQNAQTSQNERLITFVRERHAKDLPKTTEDQALAHLLIRKASDPVRKRERVNKNWGLLAELGINERLTALDDATRSAFLPYGLSGVIFGASIVFFAFIGFDSISTHSEEAINPQRDLPFGIIASLIVCSVLYMGVAAVLTGMVPYPEIDPRAAVSSAFTERARGHSSGGILSAAAALIAAGGLAGMTSVLLITFLSQARIFLAMARDGLLPRGIFGAVHARFRTPHLSTMLTGGLMMVVAAFTPITALEEMVNIGTLFAFVVVCAAVLILRIRRPEAPRPFRCPAVYVVAPLGIAVNFLLMLFLPIDTWLRLVIWLVIGLTLYFSFGFRYSALREQMEQQK